MTTPVVAVVMPVRILPEGLSATIERWPTVHRCAVAARVAGGAVDVVVVSPTTDRSDELVLDGVLHVLVPCPGRVHRPLARAVARQSPDVVHVHGLVNGPLVLALALATRRRARIVTQHHGEPVPARRERLWMRGTRRLVHAHLFTGGPDHGAHWRRAGLLGSGPVHDVLEASSDLCLDPALDHHRARSVLGFDQRPVIVWVGRDTPGKDPATAIAVVERLAAAGLPHRLVMLCSHDSGREALVARAVVSSAADRIEVRGPIPHDQMGIWFTAADLLLSTSRHEGSGYAVIEAMGAGCPVVAADIPPLRSILGPTGRWFSPGDAEGAATTLAGSLPSRREVSDTFRQRASWDRVGRDLATAWGLPTAPTMRGTTP